MSKTRNATIENGIVTVEIEGGWDPDRAGAFESGTFTFTATEEELIDICKKAGDQAIIELRSAIRNSIAKETSAEEARLQMESSWYDAMEMRHSLVKPTWAKQVNGAEAKETVQRAIAAGTMTVEDLEAMAAALKAAQAEESVEAEIVEE